MIKEAIIIDGKRIAKSILTDLKERIDQGRLDGVSQTKLAIILVGNDPASNIYVQNKIKAAAKTGIETSLHRFDDDVAEKTLLKQIDNLNSDEEVSGIIVQLPLPKAISKTKVVKAIVATKDVDGFNPINVGLLFSPYEHGFVPCTAMGCLTLIKSCCPDLIGKNIVVIGRSNIVGRPLAALLLKEDCSVTICHSKTINLQEITKRSDIVISAVGNPRFLTAEYFNKNAIVIDVGINRVESEGVCELVGDVDFSKVKKSVKYITPVPGGVGPMTVAYLLVNTYAAKIGLSQNFNN